LKLGRLREDSDPDVVWVAGVCEAADEVELAVEDEEVLPANKSARLFELVAQPNN
jgi:hypothetical protein